MPTRTEASPETTLYHPGTPVAHTDADGEESSGKRNRVRSQYNAGGRRMSAWLQTAQGRKRTRIESEAAGMAPRQPPRQHPDVEWIESVS